MLHYLVSNPGNDRQRFMVEYRVENSLARLLMLDFLPSMAVARHLAFQAEIGNAAVLESMWRRLAEALQQE